MLSGFDLRVGPAVHAFHIHACEIRVFLVQIGPLADSARLAGDVRANKVLAGISHLFSGFARDVKRFILGRFGDSFDSFDSFDFFGVCGHVSLFSLINASTSVNASVNVFYQFFLKMDKNPY